MIILMIIAALAIVGLCMGSFVNALVWRIHAQSIHKSKGLDGLKPSDLSIVKGRSMCPSCHHELAARDLLPVLSWLFLKGKCRYCNKTISKQYPIVEIKVAALFVLSYLLWPNNLNTTLDVTLFIVWLILLVGLSALSLYDILWKILPNRIIYPLSLFAIAYAVVNILISNHQLKAIINDLLAVLVAGGIFYVLFQVSDGKWIGGGDVKLGWLLGLIVSTPARAVLLIFVASLSGCLFSLPLIISHKLNRKTNIPFGPFLIFGAIIVTLFGHAILTWYSNTFLPYGV
jgi:leader peptidase (prepilin peptidase)/N-methyltransferase